MHVTTRPLTAALTVGSVSLALVVALSGCTATGGGSAALADAPSVSAPSGDAPPSDLSGLTAEDGYIPDGASVSLDDGVPAVQRLDPHLLDALRAADADAESRGTTITIADGWRSERYQEYLFARAVEQYGSEEEASKWVKRGADSTHVSGDAVDIATADAMDFLNRFGAEWGLCQVYANEAWHFELRTEPGGECPAQEADGRG